MSFDDKHLSHIDGFGVPTEPFHAMDDFNQHYQPFDQDPQANMQTFMCQPAEPNPEASIFHQIEKEQELEIFDVERQDYDQDAEMENEDEHNTVDHFHEQRFF